MIIVRFNVTGTGPFPLDMLRYDGCYPATSRDATRAQDPRCGGRGVREERTIAVERAAASRAEARRWRPTVARWESFGWAVSDVRGLS